MSHGRRARRGRTQGSGVAALAVPFVGDVIVNDTFTEAGATALAAHVSEVGGGWQLTTAGGSAIVRAGAGYVSDANGASDNRYSKPVALSGSPTTYTVTALIAQLNPSASRGVSLRVRLANAADNTPFCEFKWDGFNNRWTLQVNSGAQSVAVDESWPGNNTEMAIVVTPTQLRGYVRLSGQATWTLKCTLDTVAGAANNFVGLTLANFAGGGLDSVRVSSYVVTTGELDAGDVDVTNRPSDVVPIVQRNFRALTESGWLDTAAGGFSIQNIASPDGDNSVGRMTYAAGFVAGNGPGNTYYPVAGANKTELFVRIRGFRVSSNWVGPETPINKIFFFWHGTGPNLYVQCVGGVEWNGVENVASTTAPLYFRLNTQMPSAIQTRDYELGQAALGGVDYECVRGTAYDIEIHLQENLVGSEDTGRARMWVRESTQLLWTLVADSNVEVPTYDAGAFDGLIFWDVAGSHYFNGEQRWNPTWGGLSSYNVPAEQYQEIDSILIAAK
jgi:hypothetical protein